MSKAIYRLIIEIIFLVALVLIIWQDLPKFQDLSLIQTEVKEKKLEIQSQEEYFSSLSSTLEELKKYEVELAKVSSALPSDSPLSISNLSDFLQKTSSQNGLILRKISTVSSPNEKVSTKEKTGLKENYISLTLEGSYPSFKNFLSVLEQSARLIEVENISFLSPEKGDIFSFDLRIKVYSY